MTCEVNISELVGKTLVNVEQVGNEKLVFSAKDGTQYEMYHDQDCESVTIEDVAGNLGDLIGVPILKAEEVSNTEESAERMAAKEAGSDDSWTWTFYHLGTVNGYVTIRWYGTSNGYYSERVSFSRTN